MQTGDVKAAGLYLRDYGQTYSDAGLAQSKLWPVGTLCITIAANIAETSILGVEACFPDSVIGFVADESKVDTRFIKYLFDAALKKRYRSFTQGAAQDNLSQTKLLSIRFPVPEWTVQRKIADALSAYDDLIENNQRRIALLEEAARLLYREWFVHFRFPGHEHVNVVEGVPEGWETVDAASAMVVRSGGTPKTGREEFWDGGIPFFTPKDATRSPFVVETERTISDDGLRSCNSALYSPGTIFVTARGTVGKLNMPIVSMAMNQSCYALESTCHLGQKHLFLALESGINRLRAEATGAVFDAIVVDTFSHIPLIIPPRRTADEFAQGTDAMFDQIGNLVQQNHRLAAARDLLLPRLMNGELAV